MRVLSSLTNRIFLASALLAVLSIGMAVYVVNVRLTSEVEGELQRGLREAGHLVEQHRLALSEQFLRMARLVADLPKLKAAVDVAHPPTVQPLAEDYRVQLDAALVVITHRSGRLLAHAGDPRYAGPRVAARSAVSEALAGREATAFWRSPGGILQVASVPIVIGPQPQEILGALTVGFALDDRLASRFQLLTRSEIAFAIDGRIQASTLPAVHNSPLLPYLGAAGIRRFQLGSDEYVALAQPLSVPALGDARLRVTAAEPGPTVLILRSRTERLRILRPLHLALAATGVVAVALATLLSYALARTVTRPLRAVTAAMGEMAAHGDLTRRGDIPAAGRWQDEDTRLLTSTFVTMTDALARFQREAALKERLSSLGRLSTVIAHEVRNPLMIVKAAVRTLRQEGASAADRAEAVADIEGEILRLNRLVDDVLDFARPVRFELAPADINRVCRAAAAAAMAGGSETATRLGLDPSLPAVVTDAERLHIALVNVLTNARHAVESSGNGGAPAVELVTRAAGPGAVIVLVRDRGPGIAPEDLSRVFEPYFTTKRGGSGLGLAIAKNIVEGLGGAIAVSSRSGEGTEVRLDLPVTPPAPAGPRRAGA